VSAAVDFTESAERYSSGSPRGMRGGRYMRFPSAAEAVRFAIEQMPGEALRGMAIEFGDDRYEGEAIRGLYLSSDYPLQRQVR
jgi:hypothetical protein